MTGRDAVGQKVCDVPAGNERLCRLETANAVLRIIASHGRRFFSQDSDRRERMENPRISRFEMATNGRLWFRDKHTDRLIFVHFEPTCRSRWRGFSEGGTLQSLIKALRDYILRGDERWLRAFGPWPEWVCGGDLWGYGEEEMAAVRREIVALMGIPLEAAHA